MRDLSRIDAGVVCPDRAAVRQRIGIDESDPVSPRLEDLLERAAALLAHIAAPVVLVEALTRDQFAAVYDASGGNAPASPLDRIFARAARLALFTGTLGSAIDRTIHDEFQRGDPALAYVLDATASGAADRLAYVAAERFGSSAGAAFHGAPLRVLPYSPGYCGWHVSGQRALFAHLRPAEIGVTLNPSCLMDPLKSVSGVIVAGSAAVHRFRPTFSFCDACATHACRARMASVK